MRSGVLVLLGLAAAFVTACGGAATPSPSPTPSASSSTSVQPTSTAGAATASSWTVGSASKAVVSVREQLVGVNLPSDAVLTATGASGSFAINPDGTFSPDSKISFDLSTLRSDQADRDNFVKRTTINVNRFPEAVFVPTKATGLALPMPASGDLKFTLAGTITIRGVSKDVTFDVAATRSGAQLTATATAAPTWRFEDFGMTPPSVPFRVVSVNDEIRLVVTLVATGPAA